MTSWLWWLPGGWGYNVPTLLLLGWAVVDVAVLIIVQPLTRLRRLTPYLGAIVDYVAGMVAPNEADRYRTKK